MVNSWRLVIWTTDMPCVRDLPAVRGLQFVRVFQPMMASGHTVLRNRGDRTCAC
jgi:hypothetical protein